MEILKQQFARIQEQLAGLTATQRMLTASLVAIMVLTVMLWGRYATTPDMVAVLNSSFDDQQIVQATMALKAEGIDSQVSGDHIMVPADKHDQALAILSYKELLPVDSKSGFDDIIKMTNPFDTDKKSDLMFTRARAAEISQIINEWHGVADAKVVINPVIDRRIGDTLKPSAAVSIRTRGGDVDVKHLVESAASTVASATSGLDRSHVSVIIDGHTYKPHDSNADGGLSSGEVYQETEEREQHLKDKIADSLHNYNDPLISVSVALEMQSRVATKTSYDPLTSVQKESSTDNQNDENNQTTPAAEPGVGSNVGATLAASTSSGGTSTTSEREKTEFTNAIGSTVETTTTPSGQEQVVSAAVGLPKSHFLEEYKRANGSAKDPDDETLQKSADAELKWVRRQVQAACGLKTDETIYVNFYPDAPVDTTTSEASAQLGSSGLTIGGHIKEIAIGGLAMLSLFMVLMMVRKNGPATIALATAGANLAADPRETPIYDGDDEVAAVVGGGQNAMDGMELDPEAMKSQQVVEQVTTMIKENPDAAASLVKRWLNRT